MRRPTGAGTIEHHPKGYRIRHTGADGVRRSFGIYPTKDEAERMLSAIQTEMLAAGVGTALGVTLDAYAQRVFDARELEGYRSVHTDRERWAYVRRAPWHLWPMSAIATADIRTWVKALAGKGGAKLSVSTRQNALLVVRQVFAAAVEDGTVGVVENPTNGVTVRSHGRITEEMHPLSQASLNALLSIVPEPTKHIVAFAAGTGMREGEIRSLLLADVHADAEHPHIKVRFGKPGLSTKGGRVRTVPLWGLALDAWTGWSAQLAAFCPVNPKGLAFPTKAGDVRPRSKIVYRPHWYAWLHAAGIPRPFRFHDLRHTCATLRLEEGWSLEEVKDLLGHSTVRVTERYVHSTGAVARRAAQAHSKPTPSNEPKGKLSKKVVEAPGIEPLSVAYDYAHFTAFMGSVGALQNLAVTYLRALGTGAPDVHAIGARLADAVLGMADGVRQVAPAICAADSPIAQIG